MIAQWIPDGVLRAMRPGASATDFLWLWGATLAVIVVVMLGTGAFFEVANARFPQNRVQKNRINPNKWAELRTLPASVLALTFCFAAGLFAQAQGWAQTPLAPSWWSVPLTFAASVVLYDAWFYWVHRLLHWPPLFSLHATHHKSLAPTVWTNHYESVADELAFSVYWILIVFVLPIPWQVLVAQKILDQILSMLGHAGFEHFASPLGRKPWPLASTVFHDQHHSGFRYNYAHTFSLWDRLMGTLHPAYDATAQSFERGFRKDASR